VAASIKHGCGCMCWLHFSLVAVSAVFLLVAVAALIKRDCGCMCWLCFDHWLVAVLVVFLLVAVLAAFFIGGCG